VVFGGVASNLVSGTDSNGANDAFLFERASGAITVVSRAASGAGDTANQSSHPQAMTPDGAYVAFYTFGTNLVAGVTDANDSFDTYVFDRAAGTLTLVSHAAGAPATTADGGSHSPRLWISGGQLQVAFLSRATDLVTGVTDTNMQNDVFRYDGGTGDIDLVSHRHGDPTIAGNAGANGNLLVSAAGDWIGWDAFDSDLSAAVDANLERDVYLHETAADLTEAVSLRHPTRPSAAAGGWSNQGIAVSADGRWVAFTSQAVNIVPGQTDTNGDYDVFLVDRMTGDVSLVSRVPAGPATTANAGSTDPSISADGAWVAFRSDGDDLVAGDANGETDVFLYARATGEVTLVSHRAGAADESGDGPSREPVVAAGGGWVAFVSNASDLVAGQDDATGNADVFLHEIATGDNMLVSRMPGMPATPRSEASGDPSISADGRWVAFISKVPDLVVDQVDSNGADDVFLFDRTDGSMALASHVFGDPVEASGGRNPRLSADGGWLAFESNSDFIVLDQDDGNAGSDVFLYERASGLNRLVSHASHDEAATADSESFQPAVSADGAWVAFEGDAGNYVAGQAAAGSSNVLLWSRADGSLTLVSHNELPDAVTGGDDDSFDARISADGGRVLFSSDASDLIAGGSDTGSTDAFLYERSSAQVTLVSHREGDAAVAGNDDSWPTVFASSGNGAAFVSRATDLVAADHNGAPDAFFATLAVPGAFHTVTPCRLLDTRLSGPAVAAEETRVLDVPAASCGVPWNASAVSINVTVTAASGVGNLKVFPADQAVPDTSTLNFTAAVTRANNAVTGLAAGEGTLALRPTIAGDGSVHVIVDVNGWFE
jgi:Tol biopolymer transport system component